MSKGKLTVSCIAETAKRLGLGEKVKNIRTLCTKEERSLIKTKSVDLIMEVCTKNNITWTRTDAEHYVSDRFVKDPAFNNNQKYIPGLKKSSSLDLDFANLFNNAKAEDDNEEVIELDPQE